MELGRQIKKYRNELSMSQDTLAERVFVSRQTISNWENDKSYPDVNSLVLLSEVFHTSIDNLIKGDIEIMKQEVRNEDKKQFERLSQVFAAATLYVALLVEKKKKQFNIQTYKEIVAFAEGEGLDEIAKAREEGKRPYQKLLLAVAAGTITLVIAVAFAMLLK